MSGVVRIGTFNYENGGLREDGRIELGPLIETIARHPVDVLMLGECPQYRRDGERPLWEATNRLSELLGGSARYLPFYSQRVGRKNHSMLLVSSDVVEPVQWHDPMVADTGYSVAGFLRARVLGVPMWLSSIHWPGGAGRAEFDRQAAILTERSVKPTIIAGDFNATSSWEKDIRPADWGAAHLERGSWWKPLQKGRYDTTSGRWVVDTAQLDYLRHDLQFRDFGELADDPTPTTHEQNCSMRIDRIMASYATPGALVPGSYQVHRPSDAEAVSDHDYVTAAWDLAPTRTAQPRTDADQLTGAGTG
ncbi:MULTISPECIES: endonuclease/exonuclease/phosphatase family protein [Actinoalloteichus]|uniref:Endonuclease/exonuclease/phosphatase family protein n=1 Tax=Actinoalloteichus fjordicus TaxID=1612552 RepID=A0AAC9LDY7_9PSEU|nr:MULTISPECIES: endonuclease/exonuclease/phosphatase family protein [Actinoalloteichus]APU16218.1 endonuclease/exonuclease/phosphatase family protein [Actinoalloteichus fjordicus]APU22278.1 endonuclease/exonuclease/phosphatase family protein [Actinoalloteichus sp. GBA129-24]